MSLMSPRNLFDPLWYGLDNNPYRDQIVERFGELQGRPENEQNYNHVLLQEAINFVENKMIRVEAIQRTSKAAEEYDDIFRAEEIMKEISNG